MEEKVTVTQELINEWKDKYKFIYRVPIASSVFYYRTITRDDYKDITISQMEGKLKDYERAIVERCLLNSFDFDDETLFTKGGIYTTLSDEILKKSGFDDTIESEQL